MKKKIEHKICLILKSEVFLAENLVEDLERHNLKAQITLK